MSAEIDHAAGLEDFVNDAQDTRIAKGSVTDDVSDVEGGIERGELEELGGKRDLLPGVGSGEAVGQDDVEAAGGIGEEKRQAEVPIVQLAFVGIPFLVS
jgi:hypothetical protein